VDKIESLKQKKREIREGPEPGIRKRLFSDKGMLTPRARIEHLLDPGSFFEIDMLATHQCRDFGMDKRELPADGVITGHGRIDGRKVCVYAQDFSAMGGSFGEMHGRKICALMDTAVEMGVPVLGICHSGGLRLQETLGAEEMFGQLFRRSSIYSGVVPQIAVVLGVVAGGQAFAPGLMDFTLMTRNSVICIAGPAFVKAQTGRKITETELGSAGMHARISGLVDVVRDREEEVLEAARQLVGFLPLNWQERPPRRAAGDDPERRTESLNQVLPKRSKTPFDMHQVLLPVLDEQAFFELKPGFAPNLIIGFGRLSGEVVGVVANQSTVLGGVIDIKAAEKAARFVRFCDAFGIPIISFQDSPGFLVGKEMEQGGIIYKGAKLMHAYAEATVPKITVLVRKAYAASYLAMGSHYIGADFVYAWPGAEISTVAAETAAAILFKEEMAGAKDQDEVAALHRQYYDTYVNPYKAASLRHINDIIEPAETRPVLIRSLDLVREKQQLRPEKKHGNIPL
jgi:acetyl-CoA carboxylase carboxyltransferase component